MRAAHVTQSVSRYAGGLFESVRHLCHAIRDPGGVETTVLGLADARAVDDMACWQPLPVRACKVFGPQRFGFAPGLDWALKEVGPDITHLHGIWQYSSWAVLRWARRTGRPYLISPRGMLEPWALKRSSLRKKAIGRLFQTDCLRRASCFHATSSEEANSVRSAGGHAPIAVLPNGVHLPPELPPPRPTERRRRALFLSRIHPKKGLLDLVRAWAQVRPENWELLVVGPDEGGHLREVKEAARNCRLDGTIQFPGEVWGEAKTKLFASADLFVLPSYSENFGLVVAEALASAVPAITTRATPWRELETSRCGWWIDVGPEPLAAALKEAVALAPDNLRAMGRRGRKLVEANYSWEPIGRKMVVTYEWLLGMGERPEFVLVEH